MPARRGSGTWSMRSAERSAAELLERAPLGGGDRHRAPDVAVYPHADRVAQGGTLAVLEQRPGLLERRTADLGDADRQLDDERVADLQQVVDLDAGQHNRG